MQPGGRRICLDGDAAMADCSQPARSVGVEHSDTNTLGPWCVTEVFKRECFLHTSSSFPATFFRKFEVGA